MKKKIKVIVCFALLNIVITTAVDRTKHIDYSDTRLLVRIPQTFFWNFKNS